MEESKLKIIWTKPVLSEEVKNYDDSVMTEFSQHDLPIPNKDIKKVDPKRTKFYKFMSGPFNKGKMLEIPLNSDTEFDLQKLQNFDTFEYDNIVAGTYGREYGEYLKALTTDLKRAEYMEISAPIVIRFVNFGETRRKGEDSYFLYTGEREISLALHYSIPVKVWVVDLIPSLKTVKNNAFKYGYLDGGEQAFKSFVKKLVGKDNLDELTARERFNIIKKMFEAWKEKKREKKFKEEYEKEQALAKKQEPLIKKSPLKEDN